MLDVAKQETHAEVNWLKNHLWRKLVLLSRKKNTATVDTIELEGGHLKRLTPKLIFYIKQLVESLGGVNQFAFFCTYNVPPLLAQNFFDIHLKCLWEGFPKEILKVEQRLTQRIFFDTCEVNVLQYLGSVHKIELGFIRRVTGTNPQKT